MFSGIQAPAIAGRGWVIIHREGSGPGTERQSGPDNVPEAEESGVCAGLGGGRDWDDLEGGGGARGQKAWQLRGKDGRLEAAGTEAQESGKTGHAPCSPGRARGWVRIGSDVLA